MKEQIPACAEGRTIAAALLVLALMGAAAAPAAEDNKAVARPSTTPPAAADKKTQKPAPAKLVDINSASRVQLKTLPGIGDAEADKIIAGRPWLTKADLVIEKVLPEGVYVAIKDRMVAKQTRKPPQKK